VTEICYDPVLEDEDNGDNESIQDSPRSGLRQNLPLLCVCRQIHDETSIAADIAYTINEFSFHTILSFIVFVAKVAEKDLAAIRKVRIRVHCQAICGVPKVLWVIMGILCGLFSSLEELQLHIVDEHSRSLVADDFSARFVRVESAGICIT